MNSSSVNSHFFQHLFILSTIDLQVGGITQLRTILATETDYDSPNSEELMEQIRENIESLFMLLLDTGDSGSATSDPPDDATGVLTDTGAAYSTDEHNSRTLLITSGNAIGNMYEIGDTTATTLVCTGDNLYSDGVRQADTYKVLYDLKVNLDGHDHDGINSKSAVLADGVVTEARPAGGKMENNAGDVEQVNANEANSYYRVMDASGTWAQCCPTFDDTPT